MSVDEHSFDTSHLRAGFVPDESQSAPIKATIAAQRGAIEAIDSQIFDLQQRIFDLRTNRQDISEKMTFNEAFLAPVRWVAPEILCKIFEYCLPPELTKNNSVPLLLSAVCHTWRRIVEETPQLWAKIHVGSRTRLSLVEMFLRNSTIVPLDVTLSLFDHIGGNVNEDGGYGDDPWHEADGDWGHPTQASDAQVTIDVETMEIVRVISELHRRIRRLNLHTPYSILETIFPSRFRTKTSLLEDLSIKCPDAPRSSPIEPLFRLKGGRLRTLNLDGNTFRTFSINRTFHLRRLSLHGPVPDVKLLQFLRVSPALEELTMKDSGPSRFNEPHGTTDLYLEPICLAKLSLLDMDLNAGRNVLQFLLRYIRTPAIASLFFKFSPYPGPLDDLYNFMTSSGNTASHLSVTGLKCHSYQFFRIIGGLSALEILHLTDLRVAGMWEILTPDEGAIPNGWVCAKLTTLKLRRVLVDATFLEFVRRRTKPIESRTMEEGSHHLQSVVISQQYVSGDVSTQLSNLESEREDFSVELRDCHYLVRHNDAREGTIYHM